MIESFDSFPCLIYTLWLSFQLIYYSNVSFHAILYTSTIPHVLTSLLPGAAFRDVDTDTQNDRVVH